MTLGERLTLAMRFRGVPNPYALARVAGVDAAAVARASRDERTHYWHDTVARLAVALKVRGTWLSLGEGEMTEGVSARLRDRQEWRSVALAVRRTHTELSTAEVEAVGMIRDDPETWPGPLDASLVATLAAARASWRVRTGSAG